MMMLEFAPTKKRFHLSAKKCRLLQRCFVADRPASRTAFIVQVHRSTANHSDQFGRGSNIGWRNFEA